MSEYTPGIYEVISDVKIRREPRIAEYMDSGKLVTNQVGLLKTGTMRAVFGIVTQKDNSVWGRVSSYDSAGISEYACIKHLNREYMRFVEPLKPAPESPPSGSGAVMAILQEIRADVKTIMQKLGISTE